MEAKNEQYSETGLMGVVFMVQEWKWYAIKAFYNGV